MRQEHLFDTRLPPRESPCYKHLHPCISMMLALLVEAKLNMLPGERDSEVQVVLLAWEAVAQQLQGEGGTSEGYTSVRWQIRRGQHLRSRNTTHLALLPIRESLSTAC